MAGEIFEQLEAQFAATVAEMPDQFNTHQFILRLAQKNQRLYVQALASYPSSEHPFMTVHGQIGKRLLKYPDLVEKIREVPSKDIFGESQNATQWQKVLQ